MAPHAKRRVCLGEILGAHGLGGEVQLRAFTDRPEAIAGYGPLQDESGGRCFEILKLRLAKKGPVARLEGVEDREAADALKGVRLFVGRDRLPAAGEDEWYHADLIGLGVEASDGTPLGSVVAVQNFGAEDLLEIKPAAGGPTWLLPFRPATVPEIDLEGGRLVIDPPDGLLEPRKP